MEKQSGSPQKWYPKNIRIILSLLLFVSVGLILMWECSGWNPTSKAVISVLGNTAADVLGWGLPALLWLLAAIGILSLLKKGKRLDGSRFKRLSCAGLCVASCSFLACAPAPLGVERQVPEHLPAAATVGSLSLAERESGSQAPEPALTKRLNVSQAILKEMEPDRLSLELALYKAAEKANAASIDKIEVTVSAKDKFAVDTELAILQNDMKAAKWAAVTLYNTFAAIEGYQVSLYTFAVSANQTPLWTISKTDDDEKFSIASVTQDGAATTFTAQELEQERAGAVSSGQSESPAREPAVQKQPVPAAPAPAVTSPPADNSWTADLDKNASDTNEVTGPLDQTAYWVPRGKSYHFSSNCTALKRSKTILSGSLQQALSAGKADPCNLCAGGR